MHILLLKSKRLDQVPPFSVDVAVPKLDLSVRVAMLLGRSIGPSQVTAGYILLHILFVPNLANNFPDLLWECLGNKTKLHRPCSVTLFSLYNYYLYKIIMQYVDDSILFIKLPVCWHQKGQEKLEFELGNQIQAKNIKFGPTWNKLSKSWKNLPRLFSWRSDLPSKNWPGIVLSTLLPSRSVQIGLGFYQTVLSRFCLLESILSQIWCKLLWSHEKLAYYYVWKDKITHLYIYQRIMAN